MDSPRHWRWLVSWFSFSWRVIGSQNGDRIGNDKISHHSNRQFIGSGHPWPKTWDVLCNSLGRTRPKGGSSLGGKSPRKWFQFQSMRKSILTPVFSYCCVCLTSDHWTYTAIPPAATRKLKLFHREKKGTHSFWRWAGSWFSTQGILSCHFVLTGLSISGSSLCFLLWCVWKGGMVSE